MVREFTFLAVTVLALPSLHSPARARADEPVARAADQELGVRVGANLNVAGVGPGGFYVAGSWLYRLTDVLWFDGRAGFTLGGDGAGCSFPVTRAPGCDTQVTSGFGVELLAGLRWFVPTQGQGQGSFAPWIGGGVGGLIADFSGDDLTGAGIPLWVAGGVRVRVSNSVAVGGEADLGFGPVHYGKSIGWEGYLDLKVLFGVEFAL